MIERSALEAFAPKPRGGSNADIWAAYLDGIMEAQTSGLLTEYGITTPDRWCHLLAQWAHETGGFTILWESLHYTSVAAVRRAWGSRSKSCTDAWIKSNLLRNPVALGDWAYGGRMGNAKGIRADGSSDGFAFRGYGIQQITGRTDHERLLAGDYTPVGAIKAALIEWDEKGCNGAADADDVRRVTRLINGGYNGLADRTDWLAKARRTFGDAVPETVDTVHEPAHVPEPPAAPLPTSKPPSPVVMPQQSRKWRLLDRIKKLLTWLGLPTSGAGLMQYFQPKGGSNVNLIAKQVSEHSPLILAAGVVLAIGVVAVLLAYMDDDITSGRYRPSGASDTEGASDHGS